MLERMNEFFAARISEYDEHMLHTIDGLQDAYTETARLIPKNTAVLLDLGCGTGLELEYIFKLAPNIRVTGIDLTQAMLDKLSEKFSGKQIDLICASYLDYDFGSEVYDAAVSVETMHHWSYNEKLALYTNLFKALKSGGRYIECDYMVLTQQEQDRWSDENCKLRTAQGIPEGEFCHYDIPFTVSNQINLFLQVGFARAEAVWSHNNTAIITAEKI
ncbi:MAG: class I SAM-dependent methyltransferase [Oscillospiraceae bacterium]|jgi:SAM-dependent methyltransferase|nr:class I SAM-dependent methyltransferase [Oscillospiraceae bacterium]